MQISPVDLTGYLEGYICIFVFVFALSMVMMEEFTYLRKSKPVLASAGLIWFLIALVAAKTGTSQAAEQAVRANLLQYAELMLFMLVAMTYVNALNERLVFSSLRSWVKNRGFSYRQVFWFTGLGVFFLSPILDNLTTALLASAITLSLGVDDRRFVGINFVNIVVAANAGGVFSPFGDVTTLMVWVNSGVTTLGFWSFFALFLPSLVSYLIPAAIYVPGSTCRQPSHRWWVRPHAARGKADNAAISRRHRHNRYLQKHAAPSGGDRHAHRPIVSAVIWFLPQDHPPTLGVRCGR